MLVVLKEIHLICCKFFLQNHEIKCCLISRALYLLVIHCRFRHCFEHGPILISIDSLSSLASFLGKVDGNGTLVISVYISVVYKILRWREPSSRIDTRHFTESFARFLLLIPCSNVTANSENRVSLKPKPYFRMLANKHKEKNRTNLCPQRKCFSK